MKHFTKSVFLFLAALFTASVAFAETGTEKETNATGGGSSNAQVDGQSYYVAGSYIAGKGSAQTGNMNSKGFKLRTGTDGNRVVFTVNENYTIKSLELTGASNYELSDGGSQDVKVIKVEVDGVEVTTFTGGEAFKYRGLGESCTLTISGIEAKETIAIYFDNGDSKGSQLNACWTINWERPDATQPTITVTPNEISLITGATYQLKAKVDPTSFTTHWESQLEEVATVDANGLVTAVSQGMVTIQNVWDNDPSVYGAASIYVNEFSPEDYNLVKSFDFTTMGNVTLTIQSEAAANIWNEANNKVNAVFYCTNEGLEDIAVQAVVENNKGWSIVDGEGLKLASGAGRCAAIGHLSAGQMVEIIYTGSDFFTGSKTDEVRKDDGAEKSPINQGVGRAIYIMNEDGLFGFEIQKGKAIEKINVYEMNIEPANYEAYIDFDKSRLDNWAFPKYVLTGSTIDIPYTVTTYTGEMEDVTISLVVNGNVADTQTVETVEFDEEMGEGGYTGLFTYTANEPGDLTITLQMAFDGSDNNQGSNVTEEVVISVTDTAPEAPVVENIAALKAYQAQGQEKVILKLDNASVTYVGTTTTIDYDTFEEVEIDVVVLEDATAGIMFQGSGLGKLIETGNVLNGELALNIESVWGDISATLTESGIEGVVVTSAEVEPIVLTEDNVLDFIASPDWRLVEIKNVAFKVVPSNYGDDIYLVSDLIGEVGIMDVLGLDVEIPEDAMQAESAFGYIYSLYGGMVTAFQPLFFTNLITTGVQNMKAEAAANAPIYNLNGMRVTAPQKGIYVQNGRKVVMK